MDYSSFLEFHLKELNRRYHRGEVSALIGAGFSKNFNSCFPDWNQLLDDMVQEMFESEIKEAFLEHRHVVRDSKVSEEAFSSAKRKEIIIREGFLGIVSKYIERKGFRESIESYIEERIPYIDEPNNQLCFGGNSKRPPIQIKPTDISVHEKLLEGAWENIYTTNYDETIEYAKDKKCKRWNVIKEAKELSFSKSDKSIIKLHGSIFNGNDERSFKFDGNPHQQYIISREDYDNYPKEHEAFTQLMRISLLQGTFCLFGFSGEDPNFISWVEWVRDIIERGSSEPLVDSDPQKYKVFLFAKDDSLPSADKRLFYENHRILYIPLLSPEMIKYLGNNNHRDVSSLLLSLFSSLYASQACDDISEKPESLYLSAWKDLWQSFRETETPNGFPRIKRVEIDDAKMELLKKLAPFQRVPEYCYSQKRFLSDISYLNEFSPKQVDIIFQAIKDVGIPIICYGHLKEVLERTRLSQDQKRAFSQLNERSETLFGCFDSSEGNRYEDVLRNAFNLDFSSLRVSLDNWRPLGPDVLKKALFSSLFNRESAKDLLLSFLDAEFVDRERRFATDLLNFIDYDYHRKYSTASFENQGISGIYDLGETIIKVVTSKDKKIEQYGSSETKLQLDYEDAVRFINYLIEIPHFTDYTGYIEAVKVYKWFAIFKVIFEDNPMPALFFSIQYKDEKFLRRVGQEFAFSDKLFEQGRIPFVLKRLLKAATDVNTPKFFIQQILTVAGELFVAVNPKYWEEDFVVIWENFILPNYATLDGFNSFMERFALSGISHLKNKKVRSKILMDSIIHRSKNIEFSIGVSYHIHSRRNSFELTENLINAANDLVCAEMKQEEFTLALNVRYLLNGKSLSTMNRLIPSILSDTAEEYVIYSASHVTKSKKSHNALSSIIAKHPKLWDNGISKTFYSQPSFLCLSSLNKKFRFTEPYISILFGRLVESLTRMISSNGYQDSIVGKNAFFLGDYSKLLSEMEWFLDSYKRELSVHNNYRSVLSDVKTELTACRGFSEISEGLLSDDCSIVIRSLNTLNKRISIENLREEQDYVILILDRIIFNKPEGLESCLFCASYYLRNIISKDDNLLSRFLDRYLKILAVYDCPKLLDLNQNVCNCSKYLIGIAEILHAHGIMSDGIKRWLIVKKKNRFYFGEN